MAVALTVIACGALLVWLWPRLVANGMAVPVTAYITVLGAMVRAALLVIRPTPWTALGAVCFAEPICWAHAGPPVADHRRLLRRAHGIPPGNVS